MGSARNCQFTEPHQQQSLVKYAFPIQLIVKLLPGLSKRNRLTTWQETTLFVWFQTIREEYRANSSGGIIPVSACNWIIKQRCRWIIPRSNSPMEDDLRFTAFARRLNGYSSGVSLNSHESKFGQIPWLIPACTIYSCRQDWRICRLFPSLVRFRNSFCHFKGSMN